MNIIAVDAGKFQTKGLYRNIKENVGVRFRTKMEEVDDNPQINNENYCVTWEHKHYLMGDGAKSVDYEISKHKLQHKLATYIACNDLLKDHREKAVNLVVLSPLVTYTDPQLREEFRQYILNDHEAKLSINGQDIHLQINDVIIFAEACGVPINNFHLFKDKTVGLLDVGGLNVNGVVIKNMQPVKGTYFTENLGSLIIMEKIRKELNQQIKGANIQEYQMDTILKTGAYLGDPKTSKEIIKSLLSNHFKDIIQIARASNWDIEGLNIVATGGGSLDIGLENIRQYLPQAQLSRNPVWDSCIGGRKVGEMVYGKKI